MVGSREGTKKADEEDEDDDDVDVDDASKPSQPLHITQKPPEPLLIGHCSGFIETTVKIKQNEMLPGPKVCVGLRRKASVAAFCLFLSAMHKQNKKLK